MENQQTSYRQALKKAGLNQNETDLYLYLLDHGKTTVQQLLKDTGQKRGNLYHILYSLRDKGLVIQTEERKKLHFQLSDPSALRPLLDQQRQTIQENIREVEGILPELTSAYTLVSHKPGIVLFEGEEAQRRILEDSLRSSGEILQYVDLDSLVHLYPEMNESYAKKRIRLKKKKRIILSDTPSSRSYAKKQNSAFTEVRLIPYALPSFQSAMQIYDNKIAYITLAPDSAIGIILEHTAVTEMHRALFEFTWQQGYSLEQAPQKP